MNKQLNRVQMAGLLASGVPIYHQDLEETFELSVHIQADCSRIQQQKLVQWRAGFNAPIPSA